METRIAVFHPEGNFSNNPHLSGVLELLLERGHEVYLYCHPHPSQRHSPVHPRLHVVPVPPPPGSREVTGNVLFSPRASRQAVVRTALHSLPRFSLVLGVDLGIIEAAHVARAQCVPHGLFSYEILFTEEVGRDFKREEVDACRDVAFALCQDDARAGHLAWENAIDRERILTMPVAGRGARPGGRTFGLHDAFGLPQETKIAVYIGSTDAKWTGSDILLANVGKWPDDWVLVLHHRFDSGSMERLLAGLDEHARSKVFISPFPSLATHELHRLLHACDFGLCFYTPTYDAPLLGRNLEHIGMASGKFTTYLQHGLPVLVNDRGEMGRHVCRENLGWRIKDVGEAHGLLAKLDRSALEGRRESCLEFFSRRCDLDATAPPLLAAIEAACREEGAGEAATPGGEADYSELMIQARLGMAHGDTATAQESLLRALPLGRDAHDFEEVYLLALDLHGRGHPDRAQAVYQRLYDDRRVGGKLAAWALFKSGEACLERGQEGPALELFARVLARDPSHVKAALRLVPPASPLQVRIGVVAEAGEGRQVSGDIAIAMDPLDPSLWRYYFDRRHPDQLALRVDRPLDQGDIVRLAALLGEHLPSGGRAEVFLTGGDGSLDPASALREFEASGLSARRLPLSGEGGVLVEVFAAPSAREAGKSSRFPQGGAPSGR